MTTEKLRDPFNPNSGEFAKNIRAITGLDDTDLKQSLKNYGWLEELPAIADENDVVLVGHRRLRLAKQLSIEPVIKRIRVGSGDKADAYRLKLAIASNIGHQPLTKDDRQRIAEYLYGQKAWTMEKIAEALDVSQATITGDLRGLSTPNKPPRPKGGRPKGSGTKANTRSKPRSERAPKAVEREERVSVLAAAGLTTKEIAAEIGLGERAVAQALEHVQIKREAEAVIDPATLPMSAQEKIASVLRRRVRELEAEFERRVRDEIKQRIDELILPHWKEQIAEAQTLYKRRKALMDKDTFNIIRRALHPDSRNSISDKKLAEAFNAFMRLEKHLLNESDSPTDWPDLPDTAAAWDRMRTTKSRRPSNPMRPR